MKNIYFIGIGGIGMSAIARFFLHEGKNVAGYDRVATPLTAELEAVGVSICYNDGVELIPEKFLDKESTLVVYTPAVPSSHQQLTYFRERGFNVVKRSMILGEVSKGKYVMAVAGTHGKSSTTTMVAWFNHLGSNNGTGSAFLGAISKNFSTNMVLGSGSRVAIEADEFDRSFLQLSPNVALITSVDADHLDIYGTHQSLLDGFSDFTAKIVSGGTLIYHYGIPLTVKNNDIAIYTYSLEDMRADFYAINLRQCEHGYYTFDVVCPNMQIKNCTLGIPALVNVENCIGAVAMLWQAGLNEEGLKEAIATFRGLKRRFDIRYQSDDLVYIDDYAHHPAELAATIKSVRAMFPEKKITAVFQPHLYTRTRDFVGGFAESLSLVDSVVLLPIYPAREEPIEGVTSRIILDKISLSDKKIVEKSEIVSDLSSKDLEILITFGAGDIDMLCDPIERMVKERSCKS